MIPINEITLTALAAIGLVLIWRWGTKLRVGDTLCGRVEHVCDGDTLIVRSSWHRFKVRLAGLDAPEIEQKGGVESRDALLHLLGPRKVCIQIIDRDHWGRYVAFVSVGETSVNLEMVRMGQAYAYRQYFFNLSAAQCHSFNAAEAEAKNAKRGIWSRADREPPWQWRRKHRGLRTWLHFLWLRIRNLFACPTKPR